MAVLNTKIYEIVTPDSETTLAFEEYEFMLLWQSRKGVQLAWLFTDWINRTQSETTVINKEDSDNIGAIITDENRPIQLTAEDLTRDQLEAFEDLLSSKKVARLFRNDSVLYTQGDTELLSNSGGLIEWTQSKQRFKITINVQRFTQALPK